MSLAGAGQRPHNHCRQAIPADRRKPNPIKQAARLAYSPPRRSYGIGRHLPHHKQNDSFAPIRVKGQCPLRVQGGARITIAARQSPPSGANRTPKSKTSVLRFLLPTGTPPSGVPPKKSPCLRPQRRQRTPAPSEAPSKAAPALPVCSQPGSNQVPQPAKTKSEDGLKDHRERG